MVKAIIAYVKSANPTHNHVINPWRYHHTKLRYIITIDIGHIAIHKVIPKTNDSRIVCAYSKMKLWYSWKWFSVLLSMYPLTRFLFIYWKSPWYVYIMIYTFICVSNLMKFSTKISLVPKKSGFTIREILIIIVVVSIWLLSVVVVLTDGMKYVQKTRQRVIALNLAREWMEAVYQIRDTNRTRWAWVKDACWLKINPLVDDMWNETCTDDLRFTTGSYVLQRLTTWWQGYFALTGPFLPWINLSDGIDSGDYIFSLCQQSGYWDACIWQSSTTSEGKYFRQIDGLWLYLKDTTDTWWTLITCTWWLSPGCWTSAAKEFRFCSKVAYIGDSTGEVQLCGVMTNFKGK